MKFKVIPTIIILLIILAAFFSIYINYFYENKQNMVERIEIYKTNCGKYNKGEIKINNLSLEVDIADDDCKKMLGLSGRTGLYNEGMFFTFNKNGYYGFWMKDMKIPLDILWINDNFDIVGIEKDISTSTYPKVYGEKYLAKYVLELPVKFSEINNIKVGDKIIFFEKVIF